MKNKPRAIRYCIGQVYFFFCCCMCVLVTALPYWPVHELLIIPKYGLLFGPRWWLLLLVIGLVFSWRQLSKKQLTSSILLLILSLNYLDFQLPSVREYFSNSSKKADITILSANIGGGGSQNALNFIASNLQPNLILLQEARNLDLSAYFTEYLYKECDSGLCIISKFPFKKVKTLDRKLFGGWGNFAVFYEVQSDVGLVSLVNVHFETPRSVLMGLIYRSFDITLAKTIESNRTLQAERVSAWSKNKKNVLIVGDFNMPTDENIYQDQLSTLNNAINIKGVGFNATKYTSWHGIRIDHVLYSDDFQVVDVDVINAVTGDHRPVITRLKIRE